MFKEQAEQPWYQTAVIPGLLRHAQRAYGAAMRAALAERHKVQHANVWMTSLQSRWGLSA
jgi:hypothetical protein